MKDHFGRQIDYMRVSLVDRCNLRCVYCMPAEGIEKVPHESILRYEEFLKIIRAGARLGIQKVRFTGGEPLILKGIAQLIRETSKIPEIKDISLTTNGILLADMAEELQGAGLTRVNISLDTLDPEKYQRITRGGDITSVFRAIDKCLQLGLTPVKLNTVLIRGINDDEIDGLIKFSQEKDVHIRFIEIMPIGEGQRYEGGLIKSDEVLVNHPELQFIKTNGVASIYSKPGARGTVGFISPMSCKFCNECNRIRITAQGTLKPCLHSRDELDLKPYLNDEAALIKALGDAICDKPESHHMDESGKSESGRAMFRIGG